MHGMYIYDNKKTYTDNYKTSTFNYIANFGTLTYAYGDGRMLIYLNQSSP